MTTENVAERVLEYIRRYDYTTFVEVERVCQECGLETRGTCSIDLPGCPNVVLWAGMSDAFADVVLAIQDRTELSAASWLCYLIDGGTLRLPLAKRPPKCGYKEPHWAPVTLRVKGARA